MCIEESSVARGKSVLSLSMLPTEVICEEVSLSLLLT
jgi:hypothetical protein